MTIAQTTELTPRKPLRLWPGVVAVVLQWLPWLVLPFFVPDAAMYGMIAGVFGGLVIVVWWLFFSRAPWSERVGAIVLMPLAVLATKRIVHASVANAGMEMMLPIFAIPVLSLALVTWAVATRRLSSGQRRASMVASILLACGVFTLVRTGGITGEGQPDLHWRWTRTPEERLLARAGDDPAAVPSPPPAAETPETRLATQAKDAGTTPTSAPAGAENPKKRVPAPAGDEPSARSADPAAKTDTADWPGFRGTRP